MKKNLNFYIKKALQDHFSIGAFNFFNLESLQAINKASLETKSPIILAVSETTLSYMGDEFITNCIKIIKKQNPCAFFHLDHGSNYRICKKAIEIGFDSVMIDGSYLPFNENIKLTKQVVNFAHKFKVLVEGELGKIAGKEEIISNAESVYTSPHSALEFVKKTNVDLLAIAIGTAHGINKNVKKCQIRFDILQEIENLLPNFPLVLHGASMVPAQLIKDFNNYGGEIKNYDGVKETDIKKLVTNHNIVKINTDTDIRLAFASQLRKFLSKNKEEIDIRKIFTDCKEKISEIVKNKIEYVFNSKNKK